MTAGLRGRQRLAFVLTTKLLGHPVKSPVSRVRLARYGQLVGGESGNGSVIVSDRRGLIDYHVAHQSLSCWAAQDYSYADLHAVASKPTQHKGKLYA